MPEGLTTCNTTNLLHEALAGQQITRFHSLLKRPQPSARVNDHNRTGANSATVITFSEDVTLEGNAVAAGEYSLFTIPGKDSWTIILNKTTNYRRWKLSLFRLPKCNN